mmetsp:Transcript_34037/g.55594  ORF Transcript_34037/g.55594 Transcript_34037/m.55594 type:complete len:145 (-) Transcript_34037:52-486(-)
MLFCAAPNGIVMRHHLQRRAAACGVAQQQCSASSTTPFFTDDATYDLRSYYGTSMLFRKVLLMLRDGGGDGDESDGEMEVDEKKGKIKPSAKSNNNNGKDTKKDAKKKGSIEKEADNNRSDLYTKGQHLRILAISTAIRVHNQK